MTPVSTIETAFTLLNADWARWCADPRSARRVSDWLCEEGVLAERDRGLGLSEVLQVLERVDRAAGRADRSHSDRWLGALLRRTGGDGLDAQLATRMVVQAMLPAAVRATVRLERVAGAGDFAETSQLVVACLFQVVRRYPLARRPARIAANIALDVFQRASADLQRESIKPGETAALPPGETDDRSADRGPGHASPVDPAECAWLALVADAAARVGLHGGEDRRVVSGVRGEVLELLLWALAERVLGEDEARAVAAYYRAGAPTDRVAAAGAGRTPSALRKRRSRAVCRLRDAAPRYLAAA